MKGCKKKGICSYYKKKTIIILFENKFKSKRYLMEQYPKCYKFYFILNNNNKKKTPLKQLRYLDLIGTGSAPK